MFQGDLETVSFSNCRKEHSEDKINFVHIPNANNKAIPYHWPTTNFSIMKNMMIKEQCYETPYFIVEIRGREAKPHWKGRVRVVRKDTMEVVKAVSIRFKNSKFDLLEEAGLEAAKFNIKELETKPSDWEDPVRLVLAEYERYREDTCRFFRIDRDKTFTADEHSTILREAINVEWQWGFKIVKMINDLTEKQLSRLIQSSDNEYEAYLLAEDSAILDQVRNKALIFEYIMHPSAELISLHQQHCKRIGINLSGEQLKLRKDKTWS